MKLVIFDIDGTLTSTSRVDSDYLAQVLMKFVGVPEIDTDWANYPSFTDIGIADQVALKHLNRSLTNGEADQLEKEFLSLLSSTPSAQIQALPGALKFVQRLVESEDYQVAIATGSWKTSAEHKLGLTNIPYQDIPMATCNDSHLRDEIMLVARARALNHYGCPGFDETIYFGDGVWDVRATSKLNWKMVGIGENIDRLRELGVEHVFRDYRHPAGILAAIGS